MSKTIVYPPVGIAHMLDSVVDLIDIEEATSNIVINTSSQPNSQPHLGTLLTLMVSFSLASRIKTETGINTLVEFDELENSPKEYFEINNIQYCKSLKDIYVDGETTADVYMKTYKQIFEKLSKLTGIEYSIRTYTQFQSRSNVRKGLKKIIDNVEYFKTTFNCNQNSLHIRTPCPVCNLMDKYNILTSIDLDSYKITSVCPDHGAHTSDLMDTNSYIDLNTQLRDLLKSVDFIESPKEKTTVMCDGADWSGNWDRRVNIEGLLKLGYKNINQRLFSPLILDWSGAKFSKSMYINNKDYKNKYIKILNYNYFIEEYGNTGFNLLWEEVKSWTNDPKKFFRHYSIEYIESILKI